MDRTDQRVALNKTCAAILITDADQPGMQPGNRCGAPAVAAFDSRPVCWLHLSACTGPRASGPEPVRFVGER